MREYQDALVEQVEAQVRGRSCWPPRVGAQGWKARATRRRVVGRAGLLCHVPAVDMNVCLSDAGRRSPTRLVLVLLFLLMVVDYAARHVLARFPAKRRATALGVFPTGPRVGIVVGGVGGVLGAAQWGWRAALWVRAGHRPGSHRRARRQVGLGLCAERGGRPRRSRGAGAVLGVALLPSRPESGREPAAGPPPGGGWSSIRFERTDRSARCRCWRRCRGPSTRAQPLPAPGRTPGDAAADAPPRPVISAQEG
jgi:hypothetical protein